VNEPWSAEQPIINIQGEQVALGPLRRELLPLYLKWINDFEVTRHLTVRSGPVSLEAEEAWYQSASTNETGAIFTIYERAGPRPIGTTDLRAVNLMHRTAEFGILIGEKDCWGRGYGTEATALMLEYGFSVLGMHNIMLTVLSDNGRGLRAYSRAGFREIGRRREAHRRRGLTYDLIYMDCLATEFRPPVPRRPLGSNPGGRSPD
jgi:RimJ/RimL family protein N-acetyltransferase